MRQFLRLLRILYALISRTAYLSLAVRRVPHERRPWFQAYRQQAGCRLLCRILGIHVTLEGDPPPEGAFLAVCNHFGVLDPLVLASQLPVSFVGMSEMEDWPLIGWVTRAFGVIFVHRRRRSATTDFVDQVRAKLDSGVTVLVFPEGTTSRSTAIKPFKTGGFEAVAGMGGVSVLPLHLSVAEVNGEPTDEDTRQMVVWADSPQTFFGHFLTLLRLKSIHMRIHVGRPIDVDGLNRKELARRSYEAVCSLQQIADGR